MPLRSRKHIYLPYIYKYILRITYIYAGFRWYHVRFNCGTVPWKLKGRTGLKLSFCFEFDFVYAKESESLMTHAVGMAIIYKAQCFQVINKNNRTTPSYPLHIFALSVSATGSGIYIGHSREEGAKNTQRSILFFV